MHQYTTLRLCCLVQKEKPKLQRTETFFMSFFSETASRETSCLKV